MSGTSHEDQHITVNYTFMVTPSHHKSTVDSDMLSSGDTMYHK
jgi:hypothetical protein